MKLYEHHTICNISGYFPAYIMFFITEYSDKFRTNIIISIDILVKTTGYTISPIYTCEITDALLHNM